jgi:signal transduction histidine kinase/CheY-like chemotaxis protein
MTHTAPAVQVVDSDFYIAREKSSYITKTARSITLANVLAPLLCIPLFLNEAKPLNFGAWLTYMLIATVIRTWTTAKLEYESEKIEDPARNLKVITFGVGLIGLGWGMGWVLLTPDLSIENRMIYLYITTGAMISSMFGYCVHWPTFYSFSLPIMIPALSTVMWPAYVFPWPFAVGLATLFFYVIRISKNFSKTYEDSIRLRFRNERLYRELASERDQSVAANLAKSKFIAVASHDLRQPMHAVNVYLEFLDPQQLPDNERQTVLKIKSSIGTLNAMFDALLNISKLDALVMQADNRTFQLVELVDAIVEIGQARADRKGLSLVVTHPPVAVYGDKLLLQQIVSNLVSNAIQYTEHGRVEVQFSEQDGRLAVTVSDTGCGISESDQSHIFNEFYRADHTRALHDGLGLGLSIVKRLCDLLEAQVTVTSELGQGSRFQVLTQCPTSALSQEPPTWVPTTVARTDTPKSLRGRCIAVMEDDPNIVEAYRLTLSNRGAQVVVLSEAEEELQAQLESIDRLDCILSDYRLKQTTGDVVIQKLRENFNEEIPAVIVTADTSPSHIHFFSQLNIPVLHKPVTFQEVAEMIEQAIAKGSVTSQPSQGRQAEMPHQAQ